MKQCLCGNRGSELACAQKTKEDLKIPCSLLDRRASRMRRPLLQRRPALGSTRPTVFRLAPLDPLQGHCPTHRAAGVANRVHTCKYMHKHVTHAHTCPQRYLPCTLIRIPARSMILLVTGWLGFVADIVRSAAKLDEEIWFDRIYVTERVQTMFLLWNRRIRCGFDNRHCYFHRGTCAPF